MTRDELLNRMRNDRYLLMDKEKYPIHSYKRRQMLQEYKLLQDLLLGDK